jgi:hypothetical protein
MILAGEQRMGRRTKAALGGGKGDSGQAGSGGGGAQFKISRPFVSVWVAASVLDCSEHKIAALIEDGSLSFAFNIARPGVRRGCVRVATAAIEGFLAGKRPFEGPGELLEVVFPPEPRAYNPPRLAWMLQCDADHIYTLIRGGALADVGERAYQVSRVSLVRFLGERSLY